MLKKITLLLGLLSLCVMTVNAGFYKEKNTRDLGENAPERTDGDCLSDSEAEQILDHYFGIVKGRNGKWNYETQWKLFEGTQDVAPDGVAEGEVIIVEVNDYWKGIKLATGSDIGSSTASSLFDQIKFGVKKVTKVTNSVKTPSGTIYGVDLTTNRYYFARRKNARKTDFTYLALGWYDEWSTIEDEQGGWEELRSSYAKLQDGQPQVAPHNCDSSLELNHFTVLNKDTIGTTEAITTFLYIPDTYNNDSTDSKYAVPYQFFYRATLKGKLEPSQTQDGKAYNARLNWETSFDKSAETYKCLKNTRYYDTDTLNGIREYYDMVRINPDGSEETIKGDFTTFQQEYLDLNLPVKEVGYDVTYYVVSKVYEIQNGEKVRLGASVVTNRVTLHVPGSEAFELMIDGHGTSEYEWKKEIYTSVNHLTNTVKGISNVNTPNFEPNDVLNLTRSSDGIEITTVQTLTITAADPAADSYSYTLTDGIKPVVSGTATKAQIVELAAGYSDVFDAPAGSTVDVGYMLVLERPEGLRYISNIAYVPSYRTDVQVNLCHRSGVPDPATCETRELFRNEITFTPISGGEIASYFIIRNGKGIAKISQPTGASGKEYQVTLPDAQGKFNIPAGSLSKTKNNLVYVDLIETDSPIKPGEVSDPMTPVSARSYMYTVVIKLVNKSTYGNIDGQAQFIGGQNELVVNVTGITAEYGTSVWDGRFTTVLTWNRIKDHQDVNTPDHYEIYYKEAGSTEFKQLTHKTVFEDVRVNVDGVSKLSGYTAKQGEKIILDGSATTFKDDYEWKGNSALKGLDSHPDFVKAPREYFVRAVYIGNAESKRSELEKNSDLAVVENSGIQTMVEGIAAAQDNVTVYPNPATDYAVVKNAAGIGRIAVYNTLGSEVMNVSAGGATEFTLEVGELASGMYIVIADGGEPQQLIVK